jgi:Amylo-alpha-1,6-glucosidase
MWNRQLLSVLIAATAAAAELQPLTNFEIRSNGLQIVSPAIPEKPWTVAGEHGALFGRRNGKFEAWQWPVKILSDFRIRAELADYPVPIDVNALAAEIQVTPPETTITYSHAAFTVRQHMFAARGSDTPLAAAAVFFDIESARPLELTFSFTPEMLQMWPAPSHGRASGEWVQKDGLYILHTDDPKFSGIVAMPRTRPGILVPYQEHPQTYPLELKLSFDPKRDTELVYPLFMGLLDSGPAGEQVARAFSAIPQIYKRAQDYYAHFFDKRVTADTPDKKLDEALRWAEIAIDQAQVKYHDEIGLVAGYYESADSARPGYAWFFGRDTLWSSYAVNSYGDFALTRRALDFLFKRQRPDGKIMHEYSQSAEALDWKQTPYFYAAADSTPLLVMAMRDYVKTSGDTGYLKANWPAVRKAYEFTRAHEADDGIYSNSEGTGWVESWPQGMPKEEIYLASLDQQSATAMAQLAELTGDSALADAAKAKAADIEAQLEKEFYADSDKFYAFSRNGDGSLDHTATIYPAVAWWDGTLGLKNTGPMLSRWASAEFSADWGTRDISERTSFYDPISYHQGSIWPLFTGWVSLAEYRAGRSLSGYAHLMQNADLTWAQDLGSVTELLSGQFFEPLGRSSSHQTWSSAMVISPMLRGLFGLDWDALHHKLNVTPHLPADWDYAALHNVPLGAERVDVEYRRAGDHLTVQVTGEPGRSIAVDPVEIVMPAELPGPGSETRHLKVLEQKFSEHEATFTFAGWGGTAYDLKVRLNRAHVAAEGGKLSGGTLHVQIPDGAGYQIQRVKFGF